MSDALYTPRTPRQAFLASGAASAFKEMATTSAFDAAIEYALLVYLQELPDASEDPSKNWAQFSKIDGARRVLDILRTLHLPETKIAPPKLKTLRPPS